MNQNSAYKTVFDFIFTSFECAELINAIEHALDVKYDTNLDLMETLSKHASYIAMQEIEQLLKDNGIYSHDKETAISFLSNILKELKSAPTLLLTLSFFPTYDQIKSFTKWWRQEINSHTVLRIKVDHKILAGAIIEWQGVSTSLTLQNEIDKIILKS
jgi:F0F1-type ATP synthase delta subunit